MAQRTASSSALCSLSGSPTTAASFSAFLLANTPHFICHRPPLSTSFGYAVSFSIFFSSSSFSVSSAVAASSFSASSSAFSAAAADDDDDVGTLLFSCKLLLPPLLLLLLLSRLLFFFFRRSSLFLRLLFTIPRPAPSAVEMTPTTEAAAR